MERKKMITIGLVAWAVFTVAYIITDQIRDFKLFYVQQVSRDSYNRGQEDTVLKLIEESRKCEPFFISIGDNKVDLIAVDCLDKNNVDNK